MKPVEIGVKYEGYEDIIIAKDQPEYQPLPSLIKVNDPRGKVITAWELTDEEIAELVKTKQIYIANLTFNQHFQPQLPSVSYKEVLDL